MTFDRLLILIDNAKWWHFWNPGSRYGGGIILGIIVGIIFMLILK